MECNYVLSTIIRSLRINIALSPKYTGWAWKMHFEKKSVHFVGILGHPCTARSVSSYWLSSARHSLKKKGREFYADYKKGILIPILMHVYEVSFVCLGSIAVRRSPGNPEGAD